MFDNYWMKIEHSSDVSKIPTRKQWAFMGDYLCYDGKRAHRIRLRNIVSADILTEENKKKIAGTLLGTGIGIAALGPVGGLVGALVGGRKKEVGVAVGLSDGAYFIGTCTPKGFMKLKAGQHRGAEKIIRPDITSNLDAASPPNAEVDDSAPRAARATPSRLSAKTVRTKPRKKPKPTPIFKSIGLFDRDDDKLPKDFSAEQLEYAAVLGKAYIAAINQTAQARPSWLRKPKTNEGGYISFSEVFRFDPSKPPPKHVASDFIRALGKNLSIVDRSLATKVKGSNKVEEMMMIDRGSLASGLAYLMSLSDGLGGKPGEYHSIAMDVFKNEMSVPGLQERTFWQKLELRREHTNARGFAELLSYFCNQEMVATTSVSRELRDDWDALIKGDRLIFYASGKGIIGYGDIIEGGHRRITSADNRILSKYEVSGKLTWKCCIREQKQALRGKQLELIKLDMPRVRTTIAISPSQAKSLINLLDESIPKP